MLIYQTNVEVQNNFILERYFTNPPQDGAYDKSIRLLFFKLLLIHILVARNMLVFIKSVDELIEEKLRSSLAKRYSATEDVNNEFLALYEYTKKTSAESQIKLNIILCQFHLSSSSYKTSSSLHAHLAEAKL